MDPLRRETTETYNRQAKKFAKHFRNYASRAEGIELAFKQAGSPKHARVVEIGCGDGRDAKEIIKHAEWYLGFDISKGLLELAKENVPEARFEQADAATYNFPGQLDVVFAFASLLHLSKDEVRAVLGRIQKALKPGGTVCMLFKYASDYTEKLKTDEFGRRQFYLYNPELIEQLAGSGFVTEKITKQLHGKTDWFTIILKRK